MSKPSRPDFGRPSDGKAGTPLLYKADDNDDNAVANDVERGRSVDDDSLTTLTVPGSTRPALSRRSTMRGHSPRGIAAEQTARKKYTYAAFFLCVSLVTFCVQTELSAYIQRELHWHRPYCMMYLTHSSWTVLWPVQLLILRTQKRSIPWDVFWRRHLNLLRTTALMVELRTFDVFGIGLQYSSRSLRYMIRVTIFVTISLTVAGLSWYIAVSMTSPADLTAIYNCSAFFAYAFSVPLLKEKLRLDKSLSVLVAIAGVLVVVYGDTDSPDENGNVSAAEESAAEQRFSGNMIIGFGSVLYGLYEVLYKRFACPPDGVSPGRGMIFANTFGSCIGIFTMLVLWLPLPFLHWSGLETFTVPGPYTCFLILLAVLANATFSGSFLVLISLTSPVLSSVAALLTIFIVAIYDWVIRGVPLSAAAVLGGMMITAAFLALSWSTYREMMEIETQKMAVDLTDSDDEGDIADEDA